MAKRVSPTDAKALVDQARAYVDVRTGKELDEAGWAASGLPGSRTARSGRIWNEITSKR